MPTPHLRAPLRRPKPPQPTRLSRGPSILAAFISQGQNFLDRNFAGSLAKLFDIGDRLIDFSLPLRRLGHDPRNRPAVARDDDGLASLDLVEQPGKMGFRRRGLNFASHLKIPTGRFDWSDHYPNNREKVNLVGSQSRRS